MLLAVPWGRASSFLSSVSPWVSSAGLFLPPLLSLAPIVLCVKDEAGIRGGGTGQAKEEGQGNCVHGCDLAMPATPRQSRGAEPVP